MTHAQTLHLGIDIQCPFDRASAFLEQPENMARWASGLGDALRQDGETWIAQTPQGPARIRFTPPNAFGVLDHTVETPGGQTVHVPMRLLPNGAGCHVVLTLFRQPQMTDDTFKADADWVRRDLATLKRILEKN